MNNIFENAKLLDESEILIIFNSNQSRNSTDYFYVEEEEDIFQLGHQKQVQNCQQIADQNDGAGRQGMSCEAMQEEEIQKDYEKHQKHQSEDSDQQECWQEKKMPKRKKLLKKSQKKSEDSVTKNILPNFWNIIMEYLEKNYPTFEDKAEDKAEAKEALNMARSLGQTNINRNIFIDLFSIKIFRPLFDSMFKNRYLQRMIQLTRTSQKIRAAYIVKVKVFQQVLQKGIFPRLK